MWVMTAVGLVQVAESPPQGLQLTLVPSFPFSAPPGNILNSQPASPTLRLPAASLRSVAPQPTAMSVPLNLPGHNQLQPLPTPPTGTCKSLPPALIMHPVPKPSSFPPQPPPKLILPYKGKVRADPAAPPPLRREALQFNPSLMFLESRAAVRDWLSGRGGVLVPGASVALPYLPPFISSLSTLSALLCAKKSLIKSSLKLLCGGSEPQHPQTEPKPDSSSTGTPSQPPDLPDSTSDLRPGNTVDTCRGETSCRWRSLLTSSSVDPKLNSHAVCMKGWCDHHLLSM